MKAADQVLIVLTTMPNAESATALAHRVVESGVAACVNQLMPCVSVYRWQGRTETATEIPLWIKTTRASYARLEELILAHHPYELPEIIAVPVTAGVPAYLGWVRNETGTIGE